MHIMRPLRAISSGVLRGIHSDQQARRVIPHFQSSCHRLTGRISLQNHHTFIRALSTVGTTGIHHDPVTEKQSLEDLRKEHLFQLVKAGNFLEIEKVMESVPISVDETDEQGRTMLMIAATHNHLDIVQYLIDKGSNAYHQDQCGDTALTYASKANAGEVRDAISEAIMNKKGQGHDASSNVSFRRILITH